MSKLKKKAAQAESTLIKIAGNHMPRLIVVAHIVFEGIVLGSCFVVLFLVFFLV